jgi:hypothetical protein
MTLFPHFWTRLAVALSLLIAFAIPAAAQTEDDVYSRILPTKEACKTDLSYCTEVGLNNENGKLEVTQFRPGWWSAQWQILPEDSFVRIRNRYTGEWLTAFYDPNAANLSDEANRWSVRLVKPGQVITNVSPQTGAVRTDTIEALPEGAMWRIVTDQNGLSGIYNSSLLGLRKFAFATNSNAAWLINGKEGVGLKGFKLTVDQEGNTSQQMGNADWKITGKTDFFAVKAPEVAPREAEKIRIQSFDTNAKPTTINIEHGAPQSGIVKPGWLSAQWMQETYTTEDRRRVAMFRNVWTGQYLGVANGSVAMMNRDRSMESSMDKLAYAWQVTGKAPKGAPNTVSFQLRNMMTNQLLTKSGVEGDLPLELDGSGVSEWTLDPVDRPAPTATDQASEAAPERLVRVLTPNSDGINVESGPVTIGGIQPGWWSAQWHARTVNSGQDGRFMSFKSRWKGTYLMVRNSQLVADAPGAALPNQGPAGMEEMWRVEGVLESGAILYHPRSKMYLIEANKGEAILSPTRPASGSQWRIMGAE